MEILARHISNLLFEYDCVIVPGLGGFITNYKPATIHPHHHTFYPPSKQVTFNAALTGNDGLLINSLAVEWGTDYAEAKKQVDKMVHAIRIALLKGEKVEFREIGVAVYNKENNIEFHPYNTVNYLAESYGLQKFSFNPVNRNEDSLLHKPAVRQTMRWAAVLVPVAAVALWATLNTGTVSKIYDNYASLLPSRTANEQPVQTVKKDAPAPVKVIKQELPVVSTPSVITAEETETPVREANFHIIAGAFSIPENASRLAEQLKNEGYNASIIGPNRRNLHMVSIQSFSSKQQAAMKLTELHQNGFPSAWLFEQK